jgi:hypothetical protein
MDAIRMTSGIHPMVRPNRRMDGWLSVGRVLRRRHGANVMARCASLVVRVLFLLSFAAWKLDCIQ